MGLETRVIGKEVCWKSADQGGLDLNRDLAKEIDVVIASDEQSCIETARGLFPEHSPQFQPAGTSAGFCKATSSFLRDGAESVPRLFGIERSLSSF